MRALWLGAAVVAGALAAGPVVAADTFSTDIGGDWHFRFALGRGAMVLHFPAPQYGVFTATGAGYSTQFAAAFAVSNNAPQTLQFASDGHIYGAVALEDVTRTNAVGVLTVTSGGLNAANDHVSLKGTLALNGQPERNVTLAGERRTAPATTVTGRSFDGVLVGRGVRSAKFDIQVADDETLGEGYPFFQLDAGGPVRVVGVERAGVRLAGLMVMDTHGVFFGRVASALFGPGVIVGKVTLDPLDVNALPVFQGALRMDDGRRLRMSGKLE